MKTDKKEIAPAAEKLITTSANWSIRIYSVLIVIIMLSQKYLTIEPAAISLIVIVLAVMIFGKTYALYLQKNPKIYPIIITVVTVLLLVGMAICLLR